MPTFSFSEIRKIFESAKNNRSKFLYPLFPFVLVPFLIAAFITTNLGANPAFPPDRPAVLPMGLHANQSTEAEEKRASLIILPFSAHFLLDTKDTSNTRDIWFSLNSEQIARNSKRIQPIAGGLEIMEFYGVRYPLVMMVEGGSFDSIHPVGDESYTLEEIELSSSLSSWIVFALMGGAIFGFGVSAGYIEDDLNVQQ